MTELLPPPNDASCPLKFRSKFHRLKDYSVQGIPRFILIDKNGKIINGNAKRPSDKTLIEEIEKYL